MMIMLYLYNIWIWEKVKFVLFEEGKVGLYVCGIIVYDFFYMGYVCMYLSFDVLVCYLCYLGYDVKYVCNIIDIDDKIIVWVNDNGELFEVFIVCIIVMMYEDFVVINLIELDVEFIVSGYMDEIIVIIECLVEKGFVY